MPKSLNNFFNKPSRNKNTTKKSKPPQITCKTIKINLIPNKLHQTNCKIPLGKVMNNKIKQLTKNSGSKKVGQKWALLQISSKI